MLVSLSDWANSGWLQPHSTSPDEIRRLMDIADRDLQDCQAQGLSADWKLNISYNALDRHIKTPKRNTLAYIWEGELGEIRTYTYFQLYKEVNRTAKILKDFSFKTPVSKICCKKNE